MLLVILRCCGACIGRYRFQVFDQMSDFGVTPSLITFNSLIDACARKGDIERARSVFERLGEVSLTPNDRTFSSLIHAHAVRGQVRGCLLAAGLN